MFNAINITLLFIRVFISLFQVLLTELYPQFDMILYFSFISSENSVIYRPRIGFICARIVLYFKYVRESNSILRIYGQSYI